MLCDLYSCHMKKPWNIPNHPVYSLATYGNAEVNMNICTYVTAVSMKPKVYAIAIYHHTKSLYHMEQSETAVLQLLHNNQYPLVRQLGQKSGFEFDKHRYLNQKNLLTTWKGNPILKDISAAIHLQKTFSHPAGDHTLFLFQVLSYHSFHPDYLTVQTLRDHHIVRA
jgi:flavin reductase (DIM6/NTAB) family NADH-FMN oxidoreductase RutF